MKVEVIEKEEKQEEVKYPYIGKHQGYIVLFTKENTGFLLQENNGVPLGLHSSNWSEADYKKLNGKVILEND